MIDSDDISNRFTYHALLAGQPEIYEAIRDHARAYARYLNAHCPDSREKSLAITHLEECVFWANASIARQPGKVTQ